jgi:hypothetical protein
MSVHMKYYEVHMKIRDLSDFVQKTNDLSEAYNEHTTVFTGTYKKTSVYFITSWKPIYRSANAAAELRTKVILGMNILLWWGNFSGNFSLNFWDYHTENPK